MTKRECAIIMAYTGVCMCAGDELNYFYKYVAELMERPVYTHELPELSNEIKERSKNDFLEICKNATDEAKPVNQGTWCGTV
jgi:hypothetical protein